MCGISLYKVLSVGFIEEGWCIIFCRDTSTHTSTGIVTLTVLSLSHLCWWGKTKAKRKKRFSCNVLATKYQNMDGKSKKENENETEINRGVGTLYFWAVLFVMREIISSDRIAPSFLIETPLHSQISPLFSSPLLSSVPLSLSLTHTLERRSLGSEQQWLRGYRSSEVAIIWEIRIIICDLLLGFVVISRYFLIHMAEC